MRSVIVASTSCSAVAVDEHDEAEAEMVQVLLRRHAPVGPSPRRARRRSRTVRPRFLAARPAADVGVGLQDRVDGLLRQPEQRPVGLPEQRVVIGVGASTGELGGQRHAVATFVDARARRGASAFR